MIGVHWICIGILGCYVCGCACHWECCCVHTWYNSVNYHDTIIQKCKALIGQIGAYFFDRNIMEEVIWENLRWPVYEEIPGRGRRLVTEGGLSSGEAQSGSCYKSTLGTWVSAVKAGKLGNIGRNQRSLSCPLYLLCQVFSFQKRLLHLALASTFMWAQKDARLGKDMQD